jgi:hypothetical protein
MVNNQYLINTGVQNSLILKHPNGFHMYLEVEDGWIWLGWLQMENENFNEYDWYKMSETLVKYEDDLMKMTLLKLNGKLTIKRKQCT